MAGTPEMGIPILGQHEASLLQRMAPRSESILELENATNCRRAEAEFLRTSHSYWATYTLGYVAEMLLKTAYFRLYGLRPDEDSTTARESARRRAHDLSLLITAGNYHKLLFWAHMVVAQRDHLQRPLTPEFANELAWRVNRIARQWKEDLRYYAAVDAELELSVVLESIEWLVKHYPILWRT